jgi:hypothetical protein
MAKKKAKELIKKAGPTISKKELNKVVKATGSEEKALNKISSVQQSAKQADKTAPSINAGAANMLIKQAQSTPGGVYQLGSSKMADAIRGMAGTPAGPRHSGSGYPTYAAQPGSGLMMGGTVLKPGGGVAVKPQSMPKSPYAGAMAGKGNDQGLPKTTSKTVGEPDVKPNPNQATLDEIARLEDVIGGLRTEIGTYQTTFQDTLNQNQLDYDQRMADLSTMFNNSIAQQQSDYNMMIQQAALQAQQEQEAARAFMINQGRMASPANLQIGSTYGTPQLAGTQGFKYQPRTTTTPAQAATAFTAPTLAAAGAVPQQPSVLNI